MILINETVAPKAYLKTPGSKPLNVKRKRARRD